jgi:hypothetical protein
MNFVNAAFISSFVNAWEVCIHKVYTFRGSIYKINALEGSIYKINALEGSIYKFFISRQDNVIFKVTKCHKKQNPLHAYAV